MIMKELNKIQLENIKGGDLSNRQCLQLGIISFGFALGQIWPVAGGALTVATVGNCFAAW